MNNSKQELKIRINSIIEDQKVFENENHSGKYTNHDQPSYAHWSYGNGNKVEIDIHECRSYNGTGWDSGAGMDGWTCKRCNWRGTN